MYDWNVYLFHEKVRRMVNLAERSLRDYDEIINQNIEKEASYHQAINEWLKKWSEILDNIHFDNDTRSSSRSVSGFETSLHDGEV